MRGAILGLIAVLGGSLVASAETASAALSTGASAEYLAYVGTGDGDSVTVIDTRVKKIIATIKVGAKPRNLVATPDQRRVYTANAGARSVSAIDVRTNRVIATIPVGNTPGCLAYNRRGHHLYVTNTRDASVSVISTRTNQVIATIAVPHTASCVAMHPHGITAYVSGGPRTAEAVSLIDTRTDKVRATVTGVGGDPIVVHPNGRKLYAGDYLKINVLDADAHFLHSVRYGTTGEHANTFTFAPDHRHLYIGGLRGYRVLDTVTDTFIDSAAGGDAMTTAFSPPPNPVTCLAISSNNKYLFTCGGRVRPAIKIIDFKTGTVLASFPMDEAWGVALVTAADPF
ncbi:hypothetical protein H074_32744 [Amycolatopsis decaplanina DSM 44594]|uniref:YNCE-like beta-propeller domain-containing protein n=1 Tax=Amycolatopsis decaplanina DSM 44594 TaxID=1284240 RepID=M2YVI4_9PSEU|nr:hypothetical protein H074_32744 [Amycolatopsis decaplanina DSM 44594]